MVAAARHLRLCVGSRRDGAGSGSSGLEFKLDPKDPNLEGNALIRRLVRVGVLDESRMRLDYVLSLNIEDFLERRLQTQVFKSGLAKSIHHARVLIRQRHIRCVERDGASPVTYLKGTVVSASRSIVNVPSFVVRLDSQKHIDFALTSPSTLR